jgi:hypothetical protein
MMSCSIMNLWALGYGNIREAPRYTSEMGDVYASLSLGL